MLFIIASGAKVQNISVTQFQNLLCYYFQSNFLGLLVNSKKITSKNFQIKQN